MRERSSPVEGKALRGQAVSSQSGPLARRSFNTVRRNSGKEMKTPWELMVERVPRIPKRVALLAPVILDEFAEARVIGMDLRSLP